MSKLLYAWPVLLLCGSLPAAAIAAPHYQLTLLDTAPSAAVGINNDGMVAGNRWDAVSGRRAFSWRGGQLSVLPQEMDVANSIGSHGHIAGTGPVYEEGGGMWMYSYATVYRQGAVDTLPEAFPPATGSWMYRFSTATGVNGAGAVVANTDAGSNSGAFLSVGGVNTVLPMERAWAINDAGQIAGSRDDQAALYANGQLTMLGTLATDGYAYSSAADLNEHGAVVGWSNFGSGSALHLHSFLYQNGSMTPLGDLSTYNAANAINNAGAVVGDFKLPGSGGDSAYLFQDGVQYDLNDVVTGSAGWRIASAEDINDHGVIVGKACRQGGECVAALLSPVPEPATWAMLLAGLGGLGVVGWRRHPAQ
jgi:probable HAF family extracellular repeat protein